MNRKRIQFSKYFLALVMTAAIFFIGVYIGNYSDRVKIASVSDLENSIRADVIGTELQYMLAKDNLCSLELKSYVEDISRVGSRLTAIESQLGVENRDVLSLKEYYHLLELRHFLLMEEARQSCNKNYTLVLYFYSNAGDCEDCEQQGYLLSYVSKKYQTFNTYSFDVNIDNPALRALKQKYNITSVPSLVINGVTRTGFQDKEALESDIVGIANE